MGSETDDTAYGRNFGIILETLLKSKLSAKY